MKPTKNYTKENQYVLPEIFYNNKAKLTYQQVINTLYSNILKINILVLILNINHCLSMKVWPVHVMHNECSSFTSASWLRGSRTSFSICSSWCISSDARRFSASPHTSIIFLLTQISARLRYNLRSPYLSLVITTSFILSEHKAGMCGYSEGAE